jgi:hypothetical protein
MCSCSGSLARDLRHRLQHTCTSLLDLVRGGKLDNSIAISAMGIMSRATKLSPVLMANLFLVGWSPQVEDWVSKGRCQGSSWADCCACNI